MQSRRVVDCGPPPASAEKGGVGDRMNVVDGKLVDGWMLVDGVSRLQQLGVLPSPE